MHVETNDLGFDLLMNQKPKKNSDNVSIASSSHKSSHKSADFIDVKHHLQQDDVKSVLSYDIESSSEDISEYEKPVNKKKPSKHYSSASSSSSSHRSKSTGSSVTESSEEEDQSVVSRKHRTSSISEEDILNEKKEMLYQFDRLEKKGVRMPRKFNMSSSIDDMRADYERLRRDREVDASVKFQRRMVMAFASGVEYLNDKFDPFDVKLSGWSEKIHEDIDDYDEIFEELHSKYKSKAKMAPELKLLFMMGSSAFMFHLTNSMFKTSLPGLDQVLKQNPELMKQFAAATANTMAQEQKKQGSPFGGLASMFGSFFGGGGGNTSPSSPPPPTRHPSSPHPQQTRMKGPSNIDDIMNELTNDNDRIEMMSVVTESELFDLQDDASISGLLALSKKGKKKTSVSLDL